MSDQERHDLDDAAWALLEPVLPDRAPRRGGRWADHRLVVDGIRWRTRTGSPWRDIPERYGPWQTVYSRHRRWSADGTWAAVLDHLRTEADRDGVALSAGGEWVVSVDSTVVRAHADAAGARHQVPKDVPGELLEELAGAVPAGARARSSSPPPSRSSTLEPPPPADPDGRGAPGGTDRTPGQ